MGETEFRKCYAYRWLSRIFSGLVGLVFTLVAVLFVAMSVLLIATMIVEQRVDVGYLLLAIFSLLVAILICTFWLNLNQTICVTESYLESRFFYVFWVRIPWKNIEGVWPIHLPSTKGVFITAGKITPLHRIIGLIYGRTFQPAIIFNQGINNYDELVGEISRRSGMAVRTEE